MQEAPSADRRSLGRLLRGGPWIALGAGAILVSAWPDPTAAKLAQLRAQARPALIDLEILAGLRDAGGYVSVSRPLEVLVVQEGGPQWVHAAFETALGDDEALVFTPRSAHVLRVSPVERGPTLAIGLSLFRRGWNLARPTPLRFQFTPWVGFVALGLGTAGARGLGRRAWGWMVAGISAQLLARSTLWPEPPGRGPWLETWGQGWLGQWITLGARRMPEHAEAWLIGLLVLCGVLVLFDHRRSPHRGLRWILPALGGAVGVGGWLEACLRTGWIGLGATVLGGIGLTLGMVGAGCGGLVRKPHGMGT